MSQKDITLQDIYTLLTGFIGKQGAFNSKQEAFNSKQEAFNSRLEDKLDRFQEDEKANHNLSHRMIMQSYEYINDIKTDMQESKQSWMQK
jgi:flagellar hook-basal body complex protein FliE